MHSSKRLLHLTLISLAAAGAAQYTHGATINLTASDASGSSSFNTGLHWEGGAAPTSGNDYVVGSGLLLRTPDLATTDRTFLGDALTIDAGTLGFKGKNTPTITVNNLILQNNGKVSHFSSSGTSSTFTLAGNVTIGTGGGQFNLAASNGGIKVSAAIGGTGPLNITTTNTSSSSKTIEFLSANNTYSGGTNIAQFSSLTVSADGALGTGDVTLNGGSLTFQSGSTNDYIANSASFIVAGGLSSANTSITLSFTGTDSISGLSLDGGSTFIAGGTYTTTQLNSLYGASIFSGSGEFSIGAIPEPSSFALLAGAGVLGLAVSSRSRSRSAQD